MHCGQGITCGRDPRLERPLDLLPAALPLAEPGFVEALGEAVGAYQRLTGTSRVLWPRTRIARALAGACRG